MNKFWFMMRNFIIVLYLFTLLFLSQNAAGAIILSDQVWNTQEQVLSEEVQIAPGVSLTINDGLILSNTKFYIQGSLYLKGTSDSNVVLNNTTIELSDNSTYPGILDIEHAEINGGAVPKLGHGKFSIRDSHFKDVSSFYIWYPDEGSEFLRNIFENSGSLSIGVNNVDLKIQNNIFLSSLNGVAIENWANYGQTMTISGNSFLDGSIVKLRKGYDSTYLDMSNNYWGTTVDCRIQERIIDRNDGLDYASVIPYEPFLSSPDERTPKLYEQGDHNYECIYNEENKFKDQDNDGVVNIYDYYPLVAIGSLLDTDLDGSPDTCDEACVELGMAADTDDDNDGVLDIADNYPLIAIGSLTDTDSDGAPDTCSSACVALGMTADNDDDNDGVADNVDAYPSIAIGSLTDTDVDGAPDTCDTDCVALGMTADKDDDNDNLTDIEELNLGTNPKLSDSDGDGINDNEDDSTLIISSVFPSLNVSVISKVNDINRGSFRLTSLANPNMVVIYPVSIEENKLNFQYDFPANVVSSEYKINMVSIVRENGDAIRDTASYYFDLTNENDEASEFSIQDPDIIYDNELGTVKVRFIVSGLVGGISRLWPIGNDERLNMNIEFADEDGQGLKGRVLKREVLDGINGTNVLSFKYFIADEPLPETIYVKSIALTDKALNGARYIVDTDSDNILDAIDAYPFISVSEYTDTNKNGAPEVCDENCSALGMAKEDVVNPKYYRLKQDNFGFESLIPTAKIIVTSSEGENFFDVARYVDEVSMVGQSFLISGSSDIDGFMVMPGVKYDLTNLKGSVDKLYMSGPLEEYADSILLDEDTGMMQLSRLTDIGHEVVQFIATNVASDLVIFTDGAISTALIKEAILDGSSLLELTLDTTLSTSDAKAATGAQVKHIVLDSDGAGVMGLGQKITQLISGSSGVDKIYVPAGSVVDASNLKASQDEVYLEGDLDDYTLNYNSSSNIVLSRDVVIDDETFTESVTVANGGNVATNDLIIFADQQVTSEALKLQIN